MATRRGKGEGSIYRRADGRWVGCISLGNGKRKYLYGKTRKEVAEKLKGALRDQQQGLLTTGPRRTVAAYLAQWLETAKPSVRPRTYESYDLNVRRVLPYLGKLPLASLTPADVQRCYTALLDGGLSRRSVEQCHAVLHRALKQALRWGLIPRNVTEAVSVPRPKRKEMQTLTREQVQALFQATAGDRLHALWVLFCTTGLRLGEATGLRWDDVDLATGRLTVTRALQRQKGVGLVFVEPKSARSRRTIHLAPLARQTLQEHRKRQIQERLQAGPLWQDHRLVFCTPTGGPLDPAWVNEALHRALATAGLPRIRVHDLRHTAASLLLAAGTNPKLVQELLGHSTIVLTLDTYSHVTPALHQEVAERMERLLGASG